MNPFDRIVDSATEYQDLDEEFYEERLERYDGNRRRWATAIDKAAYDVIEKIAIGSTDTKDDIGGTIGTTDFPRATGSYYVEGLQALTDESSQLTEVVRDYEDEDVGRLVLKLTELRQKLQSATTEELSPESVSKTLEGLIEKLTAKEVESGALRQPLRETEAVVDMLVQLFSDPTAKEYADALVDETARAADSESILSLVDDPQLTTPLWRHQEDALTDWIENDRRGYVNMATATGKTVLGLSAIAQRFNGLHPANDSEKLEPKSPASLNDNLRVLIVAGRNLLLNQWREEFESHLNIPKHRTEARETETGREIRLNWGTIEFKTSQQLSNDEDVDYYDLVILDEAHRYSRGSSSDRGWRDIFRNLTEKSDDILAMSGSIDAGWIGDETVETVLKEELDEVFTFTLPKARSRGIVADFSWYVSYVPAAKGDSVENLVDVTSTCTRYFGSPSGPNFDSLDEQVSDADVWTLKDLRSFANTTTGRELRKESDKFDSLANAAFSRSTRRWQLEPSIDVIVDILERHPERKSVVLVQSYSFAAKVESALEGTSFASDSLALTENSDDPNEVIEQFNDDEISVLIGPGDLLGTGIDLPDAEIAVNVGKGGISSSLIQRIGRVLRNPTGEKNATFYQLASIPIDSEALIPTEDGRRFLDRICSFGLLGEQMDEIPRFDSPSENLRSNLRALETTGVASFRKLPYEFSEFTDSSEKAEKLGELCQAIESSDGDEISSFQWMAPESAAKQSEEEFNWQSGCGNDGSATHEMNTKDSLPDSVKSDTNLEETVSEEAFERVDDVAKREPITDEELIDLWGLDSAIELAQIVKGDLDDCLRRNEDGDVCTTDIGRYLVDEDSEEGSLRNGKSQSETSDTGSGVKDDKKQDSANESSHLEEEDVSEAGDSEASPQTTDTCIDESSPELIELVQTEFGINQTASNRILDLHEREKAVDVEKLVEGWEFEEPSDVYKYTNDTMAGLARVVGMGDVKLSEEARSRITSLESEVGSEGENTDTEYENPDKEELPEEESELSSGEKKEKQKDVEPKVHGSQKEHTAEESESEIPEYYSQHLETEREALINELRSIEEHALYPPTEEDAISESSFPFGSYVFEFGTYADALKAAGYKVKDQDLTENTDKEHRPSEIVATVQIVADLLGEPPCPSVFDQLAPMTSDLASSLGTWRQIIVEAGLDRRSVREDTELSDGPSHEELIDLIQQSATATGRTPTLKEVHERYDLTPTDVVSAVESWRDVRENIEKIEGINGRNSLLAIDRPSAATTRFADSVLKTDSGNAPYYRTLEALLEVDLLDVLDSTKDDSVTHLEATTADDQSGTEDGVADRDDEDRSERQPIIVEDRLQPEQELDKKEELKDDLRRLTREFGHPPRPVDVENYGRFTSADYITEFGTWNDIISELGYSFDDAWDHQDDHDDELLDTLEDLAKQVGHRPTTRNIDELTDYSATSYVSRFGSVEQAIEETNLDVEMDGWALEVVEAVSDSWEPLGVFEDVEGRKRAGVEALLLLKRGWTGTGHEIINEVQTRIDVDQSSYQNTWKETVRPVLVEAKSRNLVEQADGSRIWSWAGELER